MTAAPHILALVAGVCFAHGATFKHLPSREALWEQNSKYADRGRSGKFITVYPSGDDEFVSLLGDLAARLDGMGGPTILSDVRWRDSPVHFRWGAFRALDMVSGNGDVVPAVTAPDGSLVADARDAVFRLPEFVEPPGAVQSAVEERLNPSDSASADLLDGRVVDRVLHFSNGGGVYLLARPRRADRIVMKEGRPEAGIDGLGRSARERVEHEHVVLERLRAVDSVVTPAGLRRAGGHAFLFEEYVPGSSLYDWVAAHFPYSYSDDVGEYEHRALELLDRLESAVREVHGFGVALMDLQPRNVLVGDDGQVRLVDLETACDAGERDVVTIGTPGYVPPWPTTPRGRDRYSLAQTAMHVFQPLTPLNDLTDALWDTSAEVVARDFSTDAADRLARLRLAARPIEPDPSRQEELVPLGPIGAESTDQIRELAGGLRRGCASSRRDGSRPYPGDPWQFEALGTWAVEHGLAGVMHALGPTDPHAEHDLDLLVETVQNIPAPIGGGLLRGPLGIAVVLAERGALSAAQQAATRELHHDADPADLSLRTGVAGRLMALRALQSRVETPAMKAAYASSVDQLRKALRHPPPRLHSAGRSTEDPVGLLDGWSGPALAAIQLARDTGDDVWLRYARFALEADQRRLVEARDGSLQVRDGSRLMPYLADGSAGIGLALAQLGGRTPEEDDALVRIARGCRVRCTSNVGLMHGRAGLLAALAASPIDELDGVAPRDVIAEQASRLSIHLFRRAERSGVVAAGENCLRLSLDLGTGSAGVIAVLDFLAGDRRDLMPAVPLKLPRDGARATHDQKERG
jgi:serine/threonine protein kinase